MALDANAAAAMERRDSFPDVINYDASRFSALLNSAAAEKRVEGIKGLSHLKHWPADETLIHLLDDSSADVRREALLALCRIGTSRSIPRLIRMLDNPSWEIRDNAWLGLQRMTGRGGASRDKSDWQRWWEATSLAQRQRELTAVAAAARTALSPLLLAQSFDAANAWRDFPPRSRLRPRPSDVEHCARAEASRRWLD